MTLNLNQELASIIQNLDKTWLSPEQALFILLHISDIGIDINVNAPVNPSSGQLYVFDRNQTFNFKSDGVDWAKKKNQKNHIQETYDTFNVNGYELHRVNCKSSGDGSFQRRIFRLSKSSCPYVVVHYRIINSMVAKITQPLPAQLSNIPTNSACSFLPLTSATSQLAHHLEPERFNIEIVDFSPSYSSCFHSEKILICLNSMLDNTLTNLSVAFGSVMSPAERLNGTVLRCFTPTSCDPGRVSLAVILHTCSRQIVVCQSQEPFTFLDSSNYDNYFVSNRHEKLPTPRTTSYELKQNFLSSMNSVNYFSSPSGGVVGQKSKERNIGSDAHYIEKENKIRIVDVTNKFETISSIQRSNSDSFNLLGFDFHDFLRKNRHSIQFSSSLIQQSEMDTEINSNTETSEFIAGNDFSDVSSEELEKLTQAYLSSIISQLIQMAAHDEDLKGELDSLDANGFNFLHYSCIYSLTDLIPLLISKRVDLNSLTHSGSTALHLAARNGCEEIIRQLLSYGANIRVRDSEGLYPADVARENRHIQLAEYLENFHQPGHLVPKLLDTTNFVKSNELASMPRKQSFDIHVTGEGDDTQRTCNSNDEYGGSGNSSSGISLHILQDIFSNLSITEKCALAISLGSAERNQLDDVSMNGESTNDTRCDSNLSPTKTSGSQYMSRAVSSDRQVTSQMRVALSLSTEGSGYLSALAVGGSNSSRTNNDLSSSRDDDDSRLELEMKSVMSEMDRESLDKAMHMMRESELDQIDNEVRLIQNNVRGWLLRKNFTNMRNSAKILQSAWRERRRCKSSSLTGDSYNHVQPMDSATIANHSAVFDGAFGPTAQSRSISVPLCSGIEHEYATSTTVSLAKENTSGQFTDEEFQELLGSLITEDDFNLLCTENENRSQDNLHNISITAVTNGNTVLTDTGSELPHSNTSLRENVLPLVQRSIDVRSSVNDDLDASHEFVRNKRGSSLSPTSAIVSLQSVTRGRIARKAFLNIRKQAVASMMIQKSLSEWWKRRSTRQSEHN